jgi:hypothetical protein
LQKWTGQAGDEEGRATSPARRPPNDLAKAKARIGEFERLVGRQYQGTPAPPNPSSTIGSSQEAGPCPKWSQPFVADSFTLAGAGHLGASIRAGNGMTGMARTAVLLRRYL